MPSDAALQVPKPQGITWEEGQLINQLMLQTVRSAFDDVTNTLPQLMFLYKGLRFLEGLRFQGLCMSPLTLCTRLRPVS